MASSYGGRSPRGVSPREPGKGIRMVRFSLHKFCTTSLVLWSRSLEAHYDFDSVSLKSPAFGFSTELLLSLKTGTFKIAFILFFIKHIIFKWLTTF